MELADIRQAIMKDATNQAFTNQGIVPLFQAPSTAKILIIGQAPGLKHKKKVASLMMLVERICGNGWE